MCLILSPIIGKKNRTRINETKRDIDFIFDDKEMKKKRIKEKQENKRKVMDFCCCPCPVSEKFKRHTAKKKEEKGKRCVVCGSKR